jgi:hypothetical protein
MIRGEFFVPNSRGTVSLTRDAVLPHHTLHAVLEGTENGTVTVYKLGARGHDFVGKRYSANRRDPQQVTDFTPNYESLLAGPYVLERIPLEARIGAQRIVFFSSDDRSLRVVLPKPSPLSSTTYERTVELPMQKRGAIREILVPWDRHYKDVLFLYEAAQQDPPSLRAIVRVR